MIRPFLARIHRGYFPLAPACFVLLLASAAVAFGDDSSKLVPLKLDLPSPVFAGTPKDAPKGVDIEPTPTQPPPPLMVHADVHNLAPSAQIYCSDKGVSAANLAKITDGNKKADEDAIVLLRKGLQWVQFDLGSAQEIYA